MGHVGGDNTLGIFVFESNHGYMWVHLGNAHNNILIIIWNLFVTDIICAIVLVVIIGPSVFV